MNFEYALLFFQKVNKQQQAFNPKLFEQQKDLNVELINLKKYQGNHLAAKDAIQNYVNFLKSSISQIQISDIV